MNQIKKLFSRLKNKAKKENELGLEITAIPNNMTNEKSNIDKLHQHRGKSFGIDVSRWQGNIDWSQVSLIHNKFPIDFVFIKATDGNNWTDPMFERNWAGAGHRKILRGPYHYFKTNQDGASQAKRFIRTVCLQPGDLPPVLDIEEHPNGMTMAQLKVELKEWLHIVEAHYGIKPIVYSGDTFFNHFLIQEFSHYTLWIANYNAWVIEPKAHWHIWQFSDKGRVNGIQGDVDLNIFSGKIADLVK